MLSVRVGARCGCRCFRLLSLILICRLLRAGLSPIAEARGYGWRLLFGSLSMRHRKALAFAATLPTKGGSRRKRSSLTKLSTDLIVLGSHRRSPFTNPDTGTLSGQ